MQKERRIMDLSEDETVERKVVCAFKCPLQCHCHSIKIRQEVYMSVLSEKELSSPQTSLILSALRTAQPKLLIYGRIQFVFFLMNSHIPG